MQPGELKGSIDVSGERVFGKRVDFLWRSGFSSLVSHAFCWLLGLIFKYISMSSVVDPLSIWCYWNGDSIMGTCPGLLQFCLANEGKEGD